MRSHARTTGSPSPPPPLSLPPRAQGGGLASAHLHLARTVCRRAERLLVALVRDGQLGPPVAVFVNRLSDYLFVAARFAAMRGGAPEQVYSKARGLSERPMAAAATAAATLDPDGGSVASNPR